MDKGTKLSGHFLQDGNGNITGISIQLPREVIFIPYLRKIDRAKSYGNKDNPGNIIFSEGHKGDSYVYMYKSDNYRYVELKDVNRNEK